MDLSAFWVGMLAAYLVGMVVYILQEKVSQGLATFIMLGIIGIHGFNLWRRLDSDWSNLPELFLFQVGFGIWDLGNLILGLLS